MAVVKNNENGKKKYGGKSVPEAEENELEAFSGDTDGQDTDIIELTDENGETETFEHLATVEMDGKSYLVLSRPDVPEDEDLEVEVLRIDTDENGADIYMSIEDDGEAEKVFDRFVSMLDDYEVIDNDDGVGAEQRR